MSLLISKNSNSLSGVIFPPGDKSISHRCIIMASLAVGTSRFKNLLCGDDVLASVNIFRLLGVNIVIDTVNNTGIVKSVGIFENPEDVLDCQNSGTAARLISGVLASHPILTVMTGDKSIRKRPMSRIIQPLQAMGARITARNEEFLPMTIQGYDDLVPIKYRLPIASAQIKSSILLASLNIRGVTQIIEPTPCRDHSERILPLFGAKLGFQKNTKGEKIILCEGQHDLKGIDFDIPGDISSAAFIIAATLITRNSEVTIKNVGLNPTRTGFLDAIRMMGADITINQANHTENSNSNISTSEPVGNIIVKSSELRGATIEGDVASMIDEYPILAVLAALAKGETIFKGVGELRFKESDRLAIMERGLKRCGVECSTGDDWMKIKGQPKGVKGGVSISADHDHRIAMSFLILGLTTQLPVTVMGAETISTSYPTFMNDCQSLGAEITEIDKPASLLI